MRASYGDHGSEYNIERVRDACTALLAQLQETQDSETASTNELMLSEVSSVYRERNKC